MVLDDNIDMVRDLQATGDNLARLARYACIGVQPSRENWMNAEQWFSRASQQIEPILQAADSLKSSPPTYPRPRG